MVSGRSIKECEVVRDGDLGQCDTAKGFGSMRWCEGAKVRRCEAQVLNLNSGGDSYRQLVGASVMMFFLKGKIQAG